MKKTLSLLLAVSSMTLNAQTIPSLPGKIEPGANDKLYFVCDVSAINDDDHAFRAYGQKKNLWTQAVKGGKYELVNPLLVRVMAPDLDSARKDIYSFYQKYAASAYVRSPLYDTKGLKSIDSVVRKCEADSSRAVNVNISTVGNAAYRKLDSDVDHLVFAVKILKNALSDEKLAILMDETSLPTDVFDRKEQISKRSSSLKGLVNKLPNTKNIKITGEIDLKPYSFETNSFELTNLKRNVSTYSYSYKPTVPVGKPTYDIIIPASMMAFKPSSIDEAKMIEKYRSSNKFQLTSYIQASDSDIGPNGTLQVKGVLATIEVSDGKGKTLFTMSAK